MSKRNKKKNIGKNVKKTFWDKIKENKKLAEGVGIAIVAAVALLLLVVAVNSNPLYGTYKVGDLLYLDRLSNTAESEYEKEYAEVTISRKELVISYAEEETVIEKPVLKEEEVTEALLTSWIKSMPEESDGACLQGAKKVCFVYDNEGKRTDYAFVETEEGILFVLYYVINDTPDIWHIFELKK